jgi:hypothetical protein
VPRRARRKTTSSDLSNALVPTAGSDRDEQLRPEANGPDKHEARVGRRGKGNSPRTKVWIEVWIGGGGSEKSQ